jgi:hypothetical protein
VRRWHGIRRSAGNHAAGPSSMSACEQSLLYGILPHQVAEQHTAQHTEECAWLSSEMRGLQWMDCRIGNGVRGRQLINSRRACCGGQGVCQQRGWPAGAHLDHSALSSHMARQQVQRVSEIPARIRCAPLSHSTRLIAAAMHDGRDRSCPLPPQQHEACTAYTPGHTMWPLVFPIASMDGGIPNVAQPVGKGPCMPATASCVDDLWKITPLCSGRSQGSQEA